MRQIRKPSGVPGLPPQAKDGWEVLGKRTVPENIHRTKPGSPVGPKREKPATADVWDIKNKRESYRPRRKAEAKAADTATAETSVAETTVPGPASIAELARALKNNVDLIYEWVYSNVDYYPLWYSNKGALGTLIDRIAGPFDQTSLMVDLLLQAGYTANFVAGSVRLTAAQIENLLGTEDTATSHASIDVLNAGFIPNTPTYDGSGNLLYVDINHVWVQVNTSGTNYVFDPAYKTYNYTTASLRKDALRPSRSW
jgi:transglutaminase-like putative cysteine protease